jgi:putative protease
MIELLSPAGDYECLESAVDYGADAIYLGSTMFGMRAAAAKFDFETLKKGVEYAHKKKC